jgi:hypothetical protein
MYILYCKSYRGNLWKSTHCKEICIGSVVVGSDLVPHWFFGTQIHHSAIYSHTRRIRQTRHILPNGANTAWNYETSHIREDMDPRSIA